MWDTKRRCIHVSFHTFKTFDLTSDFCSFPLRCHRYSENPPLFWNMSIFKDKRRIELLTQPFFILVQLLSCSVCLESRKARRPLCFSINRDRNIFMGSVHLIPRQQICNRMAWKRKTAVSTLVLLTLRPWLLESF